MRRYVIACLPWMIDDFRSFRRRDAPLFERRWLAFARNRRTFPFFVTLKRLATERLDLSLGMVSRGDRPGKGRRVPEGPRRSRKPARPRGASPPAPRRAAGGDAALRSVTPTCA